MIKVYCEPGALTPHLRAHQRAGRIQLVHFPYDQNLRARAIQPTAMPSEAQVRDLNLTWNEAAERGFTWGDMVGSQHLDAIRRIVGGDNRRDALHLDSAFKEGCPLFVTHDQDILDHRAELEALLGMRLFHSVKDEAALDAFIRSECGIA